MSAETIKQNFNALFISDTHALHPLNGALHKQARILNAFDPEVIHLVGDGVDWEAITHILKIQFGVTPKEMPEDFKSVFEILLQKWPHFEIHLRHRDLLFEKVRRGAKVYEEPGNHDENMDAYDGQDIEGIQVKRDCLYTASTGEKYLVEHGHRFDPGWLQRNTDWYQRGSRLLDIALQADITLDRNLKYIGANTKEVRNWLKKMLRRGEEFANEIVGEDVFEICENFPLANGLKTIGKSYVRQFEDRAVLKAQSVGADGIICGHIHKSRREVKTDRDGMIYLNSGDGLTHATALAHNCELSDNPLDQWQIIKAKDIQTDWDIARYPVDPVLRQRTMEFMQAGWQACLAKIRQEVKNTPHCPFQKPRELAA